MIQETQTSCTGTVKIIITQCNYIIWFQCIKGVAYSVFFVMIGIIYGPLPIIPLYHYTIIPLYHYTMQLVGHSTAWKPYKENWP